MRERIVLRCKEAPPLKDHRFETEGGGADAEHGGIDRGSNCRYRRRRARKMREKSRSFARKIPCMKKKKPTHCNGGRKGICLN